MDQSDESTVALQGELAEWLIQRAGRNTRTPEQELTHMLMPYRDRAAKAKERKARRAEWLSDRMNRGVR